MKAAVGRQTGFQVFASSRIQEYSEDQIKINLGFSGDIPIIMASKDVGESYDKSSSTLENDLIRVLTDIQPGDTKILPISINQRHFAGLVVKSDQDGNKTIYYTDPASKETRRHRSGNIGYPDVEEIIKQIARTHSDSVISINIDQGAGNGNCGPTLIARLQMIANADFSRNDSVEVQRLEQAFRDMKPDQVRQEQRDSANQAEDITEDSALEQAKRISLKEVERAGKIGPRKIAGWNLQDVGDDGNCFYYAVVDQIDRQNLDAALFRVGILPHIFLRGITEGDAKYEDKRWVDENEIKEFTRKFNYAVAIVDTHPEVSDQGYTSLIYKGNNVDSLPEGVSILRLVFTGNHYMSVHSNPELRQGELINAFTIPTSATAGAERYNARLDHTQTLQKIVSVELREDGDYEIRGRHRANERHVAMYSRSFGAQDDAVPNPTSASNAETAAEVKSNHAAKVHVAKPSINEELNLYSLTSKKKTSLSQAEQRDLEMLIEFKYLIETTEYTDAESLNNDYEVLLDFVKTFSDNRNLLPLLKQIEYIWSGKYEELIRKTLSQNRVKDFDDIFFSLVDQRTQNTDGKLIDILQRKYALYKEVYKLVDQYKEEENDKKVIYVTLTLSNSRGTLSQGGRSNFTRKEKKTLKEIFPSLAKSIDDQSSVEEIYEKAIFILAQKRTAGQKKLREFSCDTSRDSSLQGIAKHKIGQLQATLQQEDKESKELLKKLSEIRSENVVIKSLQEYTRDLDYHFKNQEIVEELVKKGKIADPQTFIAEMNKIKKAITSSTDTEPNNRLLEIIKNSQDAIFQEKLHEKHEFYLSIMEECDRKQTDDNKYLFELVNLLEIEEMMVQEHYEEVIKYHRRIESITGINDSQKQDLKKQVSQKLLKEIEENTQNIKLILENEQDSRVFLALNCLEDIMQKISDSDPTKESFDSVVNIRNVITKYQNAPSDKVNPDGKNLKEKESKDNFISEVLELLHYKIEKTSVQSERVIIGHKALEFIKNNLDNPNINEDFLSNYLSYIELRIAFGEEKYAVDKSQIEQNLYDIEQKLKENASRSDKDYKLIYDFTVAANVLMNKAYTDEILSSIERIEKEIETKKAQYLTIKEEIIDIYRKKLKGQTTLAQKGHIKFIETILEKIHKSKDVQGSDLNALLKRYQDIKDAIEKKNNIAEMQEHLVSIVNEIAIKDLNTQDFAEYPDSYEQRLKAADNPTKIYEILFKDSDADASISVIAHLISFLEAQEVIDMQLFIQYINIIDKVMTEIFFHDDKEQEGIERARTKLMISAAKYEKAKEKNEESENILKQIDKVNILLIAGCYKKNNFFKYIDREISGSFCDIDPNQIRNDLSERVDDYFNLIELSLKLGGPYNKYKANLVTLIKSQLDQLSIGSFTVVQLKEKIQTILNFDDKKNSILQIETIDENDTNNVHNLITIILGRLKNNKIDQASEILIRITEKQFKQLDIVTSDMVQKLYNILIMHYESENEKSMKENPEIAKHLLQMNEFIQEMSNSRRKLKVYFRYKKILQDIKSIEIDSIKDKVKEGILDIFELGSADNLENILENVKIKELQNEEAFNKILEKIQFLLSVMDNKDSIKGIINARLSRSDLVNKNDIIINQILLRDYFQNTDYKIHSILAARIANLINILADGSNIENLKVSSKLLLGIEVGGKSEDETAKVLEVIKNKNLLGDFLTPKERIYKEYLGDDEILKILAKNPINVWEDELENAYTISVSRKILGNALGELSDRIRSEKDLANLLDKITDVTYFDQDKKSSLEELVSNILQSSTKLNLEEAQVASIIYTTTLFSQFKNHLLISKELIQNREEWIELIESIKYRQLDKKIDLQESIAILTCSRAFDDVNDLTKIIKDGQKGQKIFLGIFGNLLMRINKSNINTNAIAHILKKLDIFTEDSDNQYLILLIQKLAEEINAGLIYEKREMGLLFNIINMSLLVNTHDYSNLLKKLEKIKILKWSKILKKEKIKDALGADDEELVSDLLSVEKFQGSKITNRLISVISNLERYSLPLLKEIVKNFKKNVWALTDELLDKIEKIDIQHWKEEIERHDKENRGKELRADELVSQMKKLEGLGEINHGIKHLLDRANDEKQSIIEKCLIKITELYGQKATFVKLTEKVRNKEDVEQEKEIETKISEYQENDIKRWMEEYKKKTKIEKEAEGILGNGILELITIISRASEIVNGFALRATQKIALLLFIDSMLNSLKGRLANIATGEGKSLIARTISIARILIIGGGNVNTLTSSELYAKRDAKESDTLLKMFNLQGSNNCDEEAKSSDDVRKDRYERSDVVYGELGYFQKDLLLTQYYQKAILGQVAKCLIVDEVDSMCLDNMCNTLYITHQIADLGYLKDIIIYIWQAVNMRGTDLNTSHNREEVKRYIERLISDGQIKYPKNLKKFVAKRLDIWIENAYRAKIQFQSGNEYSVLARGQKVGEAVINDLATGVEQLNTQWSEGLQQFIQLKHTNKLTDEGLKAIFMSNYIYFKKYDGGIYGMTGTLGSDIERDLLAKFYNIDFFQLPRFKRELNIREEGLLLRVRGDWIKKIKEQVDNKLFGGRAVLIICQHKNDVDDLIKVLTEHNHLYEYRGMVDGLRKIEGKDTSIAPIDKIEPGYIIVATNIAGRAADFKISETLKGNGGLHVIVSYIPENIRVELQAFGRSGREGDPGSGIMIACEGVSGDIDLETLIEERDEKEEEILQVTRTQRIVKIELENELFKKFHTLQEEVQCYFQNLDLQYRKLQEKSLRDKWAFWLDEMSEEINNAYQSIEKNKIQIFKQYDQFANSMKKEMQRKDHGIEGFIDTSGELIKLAKYNIDEGNFASAQSNCDRIISDHGGQYIGFAYYYKALAIFQPLKDSGWDDVIESQRKKWKGHIITYEEKKDGISLLKRAIILFEKEIENIKMRSLILANTVKEERDIGIGSSVDYFTRSNVNEIAAIQVHLNAAKKALSQEIDTLELSKLLTTSILNEEEAKKVFDIVVGHEKFRQNIKKERLSKKIKVRYHIEDKKGTTKKILHDAVYEEGLKSAAEFKEKENIHQELGFIIIDEISPDQEKKLRENDIAYSRELYFFDKLSSSFKLIKYPHPFKFSQDRCLRAFYTARTQDLTHREKVLKLDDYNCLTNEAIWEILRDKLESIPSLTIHQEYKKSLEDLDFWKNTIFNKNGELIKEEILKNFKTNTDTDKKYLAKAKFNELISKYVEGKELDALIENLIESHILDSKDMFEFKPAIKTLIREYRQTITLEVEIGDKLNELDLSHFPQLEKNKDEIIKTLISKASTTGKFTKQDLESITKLASEVLEQSFAILQQLLITKNLAKNLPTLLLEPNSYDYDMYELNEIERIIQQLYDSEYFNKDTLDIPPIRDLIETFKAAGVIKVQQIKYSLSRSPADRIDLLKKLMEEIAKVEVEKVIDKRIEEDAFVTRQEVEDKYKETITTISMGMSGAAILLSIANPLILAPLFVNARKLAGANEDTIVDRLKNMNAQEAEEIYQLIKGDAERIKQEIKKDLTKKKKETETEKLTNLIVNALIETIGPLKTFEKVLVDSKHIEDYFRSADMPREILEYVSCGKDMVLTFQEWHSPWCWKAFAVAMFGILQIVAGALVMYFGTPFIGPLAYHIGSGLISEGAGDIIYAIQNSGNISGKSYWDHKKWSLLITVGTVGVGAYLSRGASTAKLALDIAAEQASSIILKTTVKESSISAGTVIFKKIVGEVGKATLSAVQSIAVDKIGSVVTTAIFHEFKDSIMSMIRDSAGYVGRIAELKQHVTDLHAEIISYDRTLETRAIVEDKITESEHELSETIRNKIVSLIGQIGGPLSSQIGEAAQNVQYSGLKLGNGGKLTNDQSSTYASIATGISIAMQAIKHCNSLYELMTVVNDLLALINTKIRDKHTLLVEDRAKQATVQAKQQSERINDMTVSECMTMIDQRILENIRYKIEHGLMNPLFNRLMDFALKPLHEKLEKAFLEKFNQLKQKALAEGEYDKRYTENPGEKGLELELVKDYLIAELKSFALKSPIIEADLENIESGKVSAVIDEELHELDLSKEEDRNLIRDKIGSYGLRIIPGNPPRLSRPNFANYLKSWTPDKQVNEYDLKMIAEHEGRPIKVITDKGEKTYGPENEKEPLVLQYQKGDTKNTGHYVPMVKDTNGVYRPVKRLANEGNACGIESILYLTKREELLGQGKLSEEADKLARNHLNEANVRENLIHSVRENAKSNSYLRDVFLGRGHESGILGGLTKKELTEVLHKNFDYIPRKEKQRIMHNAKSKESAIQREVDRVIQDIDNAEVSINLPPKIAKEILSQVDKELEKIKNISKEKKDILKAQLILQALKNSFQLGRATPRRRDAEDKCFGKEFLPDEDSHPIYAAVNVHGDPKGAAKKFGTAVISFSQRTLGELENSGFIRRMTIRTGDLLAQDNEKMYQIGKNSNQHFTSGIPIDSYPVTSSVASILPINKFSIVDYYNKRAPNESLSWILGYGFHYMELHIFRNRKPVKMHGKIDIDKLRETSLDSLLSYEVEGMDRLLQLRLEYIGIRNLVGIHPAMVVNFDSDQTRQVIQMQNIFISVVHTHKKVYEFIRSVRKDQSNYRNNVYISFVPLLLPETEDVYHWVGLVIDKSNAKSFRVSYLDSDGHPLVDMIDEQFLLEQNIELKRVAVEQQRYNNCGPELIENFIYYLTGTRSTQEVAVYVHSILLENSLLEPTEYALKIAENNKIIGVLSNQASLMVDRPITDANKVVAMFMQQAAIRFKMSTYTCNILLERFDHIKRSAQRTLIVFEDSILLAVANKMSFSQASIDVSAQNIAPDILSIQPDLDATALITIASDSYNSFQQQSQQLGFFTFIHALTEQITSTVSNGIISVGSVITNTMLQNNYLKHKLINYVYHEELSAIHTVINKPYVQLSMIPAIQLLLQKHPLEWDNNDFKKIKLVVHPDKGGNNEDFRTVNAFQEQISNNDQIYLNLLSKVLPTIQTTIHKANIGFKALDTVVDSSRLVYEPTFRNVKKVVFDTTYLYSMYSGVNGFGVIITGSEALYQAYSGEYMQVFQTVATTIAYMALPTLLAYTAIPNIGLAYGICMVTYTGYSAITNAYEFYLERSNDAESTFRSAMAYKDLTQTLSESPLQQIYDFATTVQSYAIEVNNIALISERVALKAKLDEKGEFGQKLYEYIYNPTLEEKYDLLNKVLQGSLTEREAEFLKAKHIKIESDNVSYEYCMEIRNISNGKSRSGNDEIDTTGHYYCYNDKKEILDHIIIGKDNYLEVVERM